MTSINTLQANSALSIVRANAGPHRGSFSASLQADSTSAQAQISTSNSTSLVNALASQNKYADVLQRAIADGVDPKNIPAGSLEMLQEHLSDDPNLVMAFQSTSQLNSQINQNRSQSSTDISVALYQSRGLNMLGGKPYQFSDLMDILTTDAAGTGSVSQRGAEIQLEAAITGMERAFDSGTLLIENAYEVPGVATPGTGWHFTGPADGIPTGFDEGTGATINWPSNTPDANGQNHYITGTSAGSLIYFSWPSVDSKGNLQR